MHFELNNSNAEPTQEEKIADRISLVQAEKNNALGVLMSGIAHEINTPLSAIKASSENISLSLKDFIDKISNENSQIRNEEWQLISKILSDLEDPKEALSTREIRAKKKELAKYLSEKGISEAEDIAEIFTGLGIYQDLIPYESLIFNKNFRNILDIIKILHGIRLKSTTIEYSSGRISKIVKSLKSFTQYDQSGKMTLIDIREGVETVLTIYHNFLKQGIEVITNYEPIPGIYCYSDELNQVWIHLIYNSIQAMNGKGILKIDIFSLNEEVCVSIEDNGPGISDASLDKIFEPFYTTNPKGSGLGLYLTKKILQKHNAVLEFESKPGKTRFLVKVPALKSI
jgi:two-component system, NtrC family, sensor kinase